MESNKNNSIWKNVLEYLRFPGILLIGIFLFLFSILRFNRWESLVNMMSWAAIGVLLLFLGISFYFKPLNKIVMSGFLFYTSSVVIFYFFEKLITNIVAILYTSGIILFLLGIIDATEKSRHSQSVHAEAIVSYPQYDEISLKDKIDIELGEVSKKLRTTHSLYQGIKIDSEKELATLKMKNKKALQQMLEMCEDLKSLLKSHEGDETEEIKQIKIIRNQIKEQLKDEKIEQMPTNKGDIVNDDIHIVDNKYERPRNWYDGVNPKIKSIEKPGYYVGSEKELLREAHVKADWNLQ